MPTKKKIEKKLVDGEPTGAPTLATPEEIREAKEQAAANAGEPTETVMEKEEPTAPVKKEERQVTTDVIFKSLDGKKMQVGVGKEFFEGKSITVPGHLADEVERILKDGHILYTRIN